jgi:leucyl-tRNA synthetase
MAATNDLYRYKKSAFGKHTVWQHALESLVACIAPFAPHASEDLWFQLGHHVTVHKDTWPEFDEKYLATDTITIAVQINGKLRGEVEVSADANEKTVTEAAKTQPKVAGYLAGQTIRKAIYVPKKLVNFVV